MGNSDKTIIGAASFYNKKYYFNPDCASMPDGVQDELALLCKSGAEAVKGLFIAQYDGLGRVSFESGGGDADFAFDEINARRVTDRLVDDNKKLIKSIQLWHALNITDEGRKLREELIASGAFGGKGEE